MKSKQRWIPKMKVTQRNMKDFINHVGQQKLRVKAEVTIIDKKRRTFSGALAAGTFVEFYELCRTSGIELKSYTWLG